MKQNYNVTGKNRKQMVAITAYTEFLTALIRMAKDAKRVTATEKETESEKYTFRAFLLRLGFGGPEHKTVRKELLKRLKWKKKARRQ